MKPKLINFLNEVGKARVRSSPSPSVACMQTKRMQAISKKAGCSNGKLSTKMKIH